MKKVLSLVFALVMGCTLMAQTFVSTEPSYRNAVIEEFTGIYCGYCPQGHYIVNMLDEYYPGRIVPINIHQGYYANNTYTTTEGDAIGSYFGINSYPSGIVNRHKFGSTTVLGRGSFASAALTIMNMASPVNVAAWYEIDQSTRVMSVHIEIYYTGTSSASTNKLNVALLQDSVIGPQSGASGNPSQQVGSQYRHMHMLRHMITDTWGTTIDNPVAGTFIDTVITYTVPNAIGDVTIGENLDDLGVAVFIAEGQKEIITGVKAMIPREVATMNSVSVASTECSLEYQPYVTITNSTPDAISGFQFDCNGATVNSPRVFRPYSIDTVHMPTYTITVSGEPVQNCTRTTTVNLLSYVNNTTSQTVTVSGQPKSATSSEFNIYTVSGPITAHVGIDAYGKECSVSLVRQSDCQPLWTKGPWTDLSVNWNNISSISEIPDARYHDITFDPAEPDLYLFRANDSYGDGWTSTNNTNPSGIWLSNADGQFAAYPWGYTNGPSFSAFDIYINVTSSGDGSVGIDDVADATVGFSLYPNPAYDRINIKAASSVSEISVIDMTGRTVLTGSANATSVDVSGLPAGVYMVRVATAEGVGMQRFVKE